MCWRKLDALAKLIVASSITKNGGALDVDLLVDVKLCAGQPRTRQGREAENCLHCFVLM
jgi:hypothetical protein